jgi:SMC interacting uncharacterized protein involved in chromosome segregation
MIIQGSGTLIPLKPLGIKQMEPTNLEKTNLEAHVDLCAERYSNLEQRLATIEIKVDSLSDTVNENKHSLSTVIITAAGTVVTSIIGLIIAILMTF